jgi:hypothetical protein
MTTGKKKKPSAAQLPAEVLEQVLDNAAAGVFVYRLEDPRDDASLRMELFSRTAARLLDMDRAKMRGRLILEIFPELAADGIHSRYAQAVRDGRGFSVPEYFFIRPGVPGAWYSFNVFPLPGGRLGVIFEDITERKKLAAAEKEAETLRGLIPICANCKKIRDDKGFWQRVEVYLEERSSARFTHGLCQDCMKKLYGRKGWKGGEGK